MTSLRHQSTNVVQEPMGRMSKSELPVFQLTVALST